MAATGARDEQWMAMRVEARTEVPEVEQDPLSCSMPFLCSQAAAAALLSLTRHTNPSQACFERNRRRAQSASFSLLLFSPLLSCSLSLSMHLLSLNPFDRMNMHSDPSVHVAGPLPVLLLLLHLSTCSFSLLAALTLCWCQRAYDYATGKVVRHSSDQFMQKPVSSHSSLSPTPLLSSARLELIALQAMECREHQW